MVRKHLSKYFLYPLFIIIFLFLSSYFNQDSARGETLSNIPECASKNLTVEKCVDYLTEKKNELSKQANSLVSQIAVMDNQINLTEARIFATRKQIVDISLDIDTTEKKISNLEKSLDTLAGILVNRIVATYETGTIQPMQILLTSNSVSNFFTRLNYLRIAQMQDKRLIYATQQTKNDYANQKDIFETKKRKVETLKNQLETYTTQLANEKKDKENLLKATRNSEEEYQKRLADALRELEQIQKAAQFLITTAPRKVARGEIIGLMGNTGYSFGAHLHFGAYNISSLEQYDYYSNSENPANVLESQAVTWQTECGGDTSGTVSTGVGIFAWPMSTSGLRISQGYGNTCYSNVYYKGKPHPAFDMYNNFDIAVRAVEEGQAYVCRNCTGDGGNGVFIFHPNGKMTLYWHLR